jgi:Arc/MetJ-type ribon-helix-helix transcriptional regulator
MTAQHRLQNGGSIVMTPPDLRDIVVDVVRTIVQLPEQQAAALERAARRRGVSRAAVVREALAGLLEPEEVAEDEALQRALSAAGCFDSGIPDLARRHDDYTFEP